MLLKTDKKNFWVKITLLAIAIIFLYGMYLRTDNLPNKGLWKDELNQLKIMEGDFFKMLRCLPVTEVGSYLNLDHFLIYPFFKIFSYNKCGLAIPHIIIALFTFYFLFLNCRHLLKTIFGYIAVFWIFSVNLTLIKHATEIRPYAVLPFLSLATFYFSELLADNLDMPFWRKIGIYLFFILTIAFHTYGIFIVFFCYAFSVLSRWEKDFVKIFFARNLKILLFMLAIALPYWFYNLLVRGGHVTLGRSTKDLVFAFIPSPLNDSVGFLKGIFCTLVGRRANYVFLLCVIFPFILPYKERFRQILFFFVLVLFPIGAIFLGDFISGVYFIQRQFIWVMPFFILLLGWIFESLIIFVFRLDKSSLILESKKDDKRL